MRRATHIRAALAAATLAAGAAQAHVYSEWQPRLSIGGGYDDNVLLDGSGGDGYGQVLPGLKLYLFGDHGLKSTIDCQVGFSRLADPQLYPAAQGDLVLNNLCLADLKTRLGSRSALHFDLKTQYAQDPFAIANLGLLLRPGQTSIFYTRLNDDVSYRTSTRGTVLYGVDENGLYFKPGDPGNGLVLAPHVGYEHRFTEEDTWTATLRQQVFFALSPPDAVKTWGSGTSGESTSAFFGYKRHLSPVTDFSISAGPSVVARPAHGTAVMPAGRADLEMATPYSGVHLTVMHDLALAATAPGPIVVDLGELAVFGELTSWLVGRLYGGVYRNAAVENYQTGTAGYGVGAGLDVRFTRALTLGATVGRDARLGGTDFENQVDRDVVIVRLTWESPRSF
jgi:hypothetical protein